MRSLVLIILTVAITVPAAPRQRSETVSGVVIAYSVFPGCVNGNGYWSAIIRPQSPKNNRVGFIRVEFGLPCVKSTLSIFAKQGAQKFRLERQENCEAAPGTERRSGEL